MIDRTQSASPLLLRGALALSLLIVAVVSVQAIWLVRDVFPLLHGDSYAYLEKLHRFLARIDLGDPADAWRRLEHLSHGGRPPGYQLLTTPFVLLAPRSEDAPLVLNLALTAVLMTATYAAGKATLDSRTGLLAAFLVITYGPVFRLSRQYLPYFGLLTASAVALWLLVVLVRDRSVRAAWAVGAISAAGILIHPRYLHVMGLPILVLAVCAWLRPLLAERGEPRWLTALRDRFFLFGLLPAGLVALLLAASWYLTWGRPAIALGGALQSEWLAQFRGVERVAIGYPEVPATFAWYARTAPGALSNVLVLFLVAGVVAAAVRRRRLTDVHLVVLAVGYAVHAVDRTLSWSYAASLLPAAAILTAVWLFEVRRTWLRRTLVAASVAVAAFNVAMMTWELPAWGRPLLAALQLPTRTAQPPNNTLGPAAARLAFQDFPFGEVIDTVARAMAASQQRRALFMVVRDGRTDGARMAYYLRRDYPELDVDTAGEGVALWGNPYQLAVLLRADYIVFPTRVTGGHETLYPEASVRFLSSPPPRFREAHALLAELEVPHGPPARLLERIDPLSAAEAMETLAALQLPAKYKEGGQQLVESLEASERQAEQAVGKGPR